MKIVQINATCGKGSTGKICVSVSKLLSEKEIENYIFYASDISNYPLGKKYMSDLNVKMQALKSRILGNYGFNSRLATLRLLKELEAISPDIVHLHNLHGHNVHLETLFSYLKDKKIKIFWTFHDCWAFTGYCPYYDLVACDKWKSECRDCPQSKNYSWFFDRSTYLYKAKKRLFTGLDLTIITPSQWLANEVKQSFLKEYPVKVLNNGIDLSIFRPEESDFKKKYNIEDKFVVLGVADKWVVRKSPDVFEELAKRLDERFQIVMVGTDDHIDKQLPDNIISIHRTNNQKELAEIYTAADVFVNPTREENYPTTQMEALACGTPVVAFNTGGCSEMLNEECGVVTEKENIEEFVDKIVSVCCDNKFSEEACITRAKEFDQFDKFQEYIALYK